MKKLWIILDVLSGLFWFVYSLVRVVNACGGVIGLWGLMPFSWIDGCVIGFYCLDISEFFLKSAVKKIEEENARCD